MAAAVGNTPTWYRVTTGRIICLPRGIEMVEDEGFAPSTTGCRPAMIRLSPILRSHGTSSIHQ